MDDEINENEDVKTHLLKAIVRRQDETNKRLKSIDMALYGIGALIFGIAVAFRYFAN